VAEGGMLAKKISLNEAVAALANDTHRLLFTWALAHLDIEGRISGRPNVFRAIVVPMLEGITSEKVSSFFKDAIGLGLIERYAVGDTWVVQYPKFKENQRLRSDREAPSKLPPPPDLLPEDSGSAPGVVPEDSGLKFKLSLSKAKGEAIAPPPPGNGDARPPAPAFSCECFEISEEYLHELCDSFPLMPAPYLVQEFFPRMRNWCLDNRKVGKHLKKFDAKGRLKTPRSCFANWLKKEDPARAEAYMAPAATTPDLPPEPKDILVPTKGCPNCHGGGLVRNPEGSKERYSPCHCLHPKYEVNDGKIEPKNAASPE
jgi:hypothetical protein